jgi:tetratricopeptide (TPR) repeat protein
MPARMSAMNVAMGVATLLATGVALVATIGIACAGPVDETALREYAGQKRTDRVEMETRRLERLHPDWKPPADLWSARPSGPDEAPLWDLYEAGELDLLRQAIAQRREQQRDWNPSDDLVEKIKALELRAQILDRAASGKWTEAAQLASDNGLAGGTRDIELLWIVAEAFARTERASEAAVLYKFVLENRADAAERTATILKALGTLSMADAEKLIAMGEAGTGGRNEFDDIRLDITRARISAFLHNDPANAIAASDLAAFEEFAHQSSDPRQAALVAWHAFKRGEFDAARDWFKWSIAHGGDAMSAHGLALTLLKLGLRREAEEVAFAWREPLTNNKILFIDVLETDLTREVLPFIEPARIARYAQVTMKSQSGEGAQGLAWYAYNSCQFEIALEWFKRAVAWFPKEATVYGYALTLQRLNRHREFIEIVNRYDGLFPKVVGLLFRDGFNHPPPPCERQTDSEIAWSRSHPRPDYRSTSASGQDGANRTGSADGSRPIYYDDALVNSRAAYRVARSDFPVPVSPQNPLRFAVRAPLPPDRSGRVAQAFRVEGPLQPPRIARRVPGAGAMPYERFGIALLPAYDGATTVKVHTTYYYYAAAGTTWAEDSAAAAPDTPAVSARVEQRSR